jgi:hypothetical protein
VFARVAYASILGSVILGPIYLSDQRFMTFMKARREVVNIHLANGRLLKAFGCSMLLSVIVTGVVVSAATLGHGLIFWPLVYSDGLTTRKMVIDAVLIPVACILGGIRWTLEMVSMTAWILIRIPKISTGLEGGKYDRLMKIACGFSCPFPGFFSDIGCCFSVIFTIFRWSIQGAASALPVCVLFLTPGFMEKCVAYYDKYREPVNETAGPQPQPPVSV